MAFFVGIDVSKEKFDACGIRDDGTKVFSVTCPMNREGFDKLIVQLPTRETASLLFGMESTASYHIALFSYLTVPIPFYSNAFSVFIRTVSRLSFPGRPYFIEVFDLRQS